MSFTNGYRKLGLLYICLNFICCLSPIKPHDIFQLDISLYCPQQLALYDNCLVLSFMCPFIGTCSEGCLDPCSI